MNTMNNNSLSLIQDVMSYLPGRYYHSLTQIEGVLNKVLTTQHLGMDKVAQKSRSVHKESQKITTLKKLFILLYHLL